MHDAIHDAIQSEGEGMRGGTSQSRKKARMSDNIAQGSGASGSGRRVSLPKLNIHTCGSGANGQRAVTVGRPKVLAGRARRLPLVE